VLQKKMGQPLEAAGSPLRFAPEEGPEFFVRYGWRLVEARSLFHTAARLKQLPLWMALMARLFKEPKQPAGKRPWGGVCLLAKQGS
jgi:hypothetical protein